MASKIGVALATKFKRESSLSRPTERSDRNFTAGRQQSVASGGMARTIILKGEPKSTQHIYRAACHGRHPVNYMTAEGKATKEAYQWEAKSQWKQPPLTGLLGLSVRFFFKTKRKRDLDNQNKLILDALSGIVYEDDSQICVLHLYRGYDAGSPRIEIDVMPGETGVPIVARAVY